MKKVRPTISADALEVKGFDLVDLLTGEIESVMRDPFAPTEVTLHQSSRLQRWSNRGWADCLGLFASCRRRPTGSVAASPRRRAPSDGSASANLIKLPTVSRESVPSLGEVLWRRRSHFGPFPSQALPLDVFSRFLALGFAGVMDGMTEARAGLTVFLAAYNIPSLSGVCYRFDPILHSLEPVGTRCQREDVAGALVGQRGALSASATIFVAAHFPHAQEACRSDRGLTRLYVEAGRTMQKGILAATALHLRTHISPAVRDTQLLRILGLDELTWQVLHTLTVG